MMEHKQGHHGEQKFFYFHHNIMEGLNIIVTGICIDLKDENKLESLEERKMKIIKEILFLENDLLKNRYKSIVETISYIDKLEDELQIIRRCILMHKYYNTI